MDYRQICTTLQFYYTHIYNSLQFLPQVEISDPQAMGVRILQPCQWQKTGYGTIVIPIGARVVEFYYPWKMRCRIVTPIGQECYNSTMPIQKQRQSDSVTYLLLFKINSVFQNHCRVLNYCFSGVETKLQLIFYEVSVLEISYPLGMHVTILPTLVQGWYNSTPLEWQK